MKRKLSVFAEKTLRENDAIRTRQIATLIADHEKPLVARNAEFAREAVIAKSNIDRFERYWQEEIITRKKYEEQCDEFRQSEREMLRRISQAMVELHHLRGAIVEYALTLGHPATAEDKTRIIELQQKISGTTDPKTSCDATRSPLGM